MSVKIYLTKRGHEKILNEIDELTKKMKNLQAQTAHIADVGGDQYHDNSSYEMLIIDLRGIDNRITKAYRCLDRAEIVDSPQSLEKVSIGTCIMISKDGEKAVWEIVGFGESEPTLKRIAYNTPIASLLMGKRKGESVRGIIAGKQIEIEILDITLAGG